MTKVSYVKLTTELLLEPCNTLVVATSYKEVVDVLHQYSLGITMSKLIHVVVTGATK
jgi:hypothetical protein